MLAIVWETSPVTFERYFARKPTRIVPIKLPIAAMTIAFFGSMQRVVTQVAMQFGASVQPLIKTTPKLKRRATYAQGWALAKEKKSDKDMFTVNHSTTKY